MSFVFTTLYMMELYVDLAAKFGVVSSKPRTAGRQRNRANPHVADTKDYWRIILLCFFFVPMSHKDSLVLHGLWDIIPTLLSIFLLQGLTLAEFRSAL
jgi:hypothetical protein